MMILDPGPAMLGGVFLGFAFGLLAGVALTWEWFALKRLDEEEAQQLAMLAERRAMLDAKYAPAEQAPTREADPIESYPMPRVAVLPLGEVNPNHPFDIPLQSARRSCVELENARMSESLRRCFARNCGADRKAGMLMCYRHWSMLPHTLQQKIVRLNKKREAGKYGARGDWLSAINEARDLVTPKTEAMNS